MARHFAREAPKLCQPRCFALETTNRSAVRPPRFILRPPHSGGRRLRRRAQDMHEMAIRTRADQSIGFFVNNIAELFEFCFQAFVVERPKHHKIRHVFCSMVKGNSGAKKPAILPNASDRLARQAVSLPAEYPYRNSSLAHDNSRERNSGIKPLYPS